MPPCDRRGHTRARSRPPTRSRARGAQSGSRAPRGHRVRSHAAAPASARSPASISDHGEPRQRPSFSMRHRPQRPSDAAARQIHAMSMAGACSIITVPDTSSPANAPRVTGNDVEAPVADAELLAQVLGELFAPVMRAHRVRDRRRADVPLRQPVAQVVVVSVSEAFVEEVHAAEARLRGMPCCRCTRDRRAPAPIRK